MPWVEPGIGLQFVEGDDAFRARLDRQIKRLQIGPQGPRSQRG